MKNKVLIVCAHPEPTSLTRQLVEVSVQTLQQQGHEVLLSDLYGMHWKAVFDEHDFPSRTAPERLSFMTESGHSYSSGRQGGKRALLSVTVGGPEEDYLPRGINGPLEQLLFPITHGTLSFAGMDVLPTNAVYGTTRITAEGVAAAKATWPLRLERLFEDAPIPFRHQNGGDYPDGHVLGSHVAVGQSGLPAHLAEMQTSPLQFVVDMASLK
jgi:putative NADPH-quinone reductase